jgi:hypothetical protein
MLSWETNLLLFALGLIIFIVMSIKGLDLDWVSYKKRNETKKITPKSEQEDKVIHEWIANIFLFNAVVFSIGYFTGFAKRFPDLWSIMPLCIGFFLIGGIVFKIIAISSLKN